MNAKLEKILCWGVVLLLAGGFALELLWLLKLL